jgi:hypothetical protein
MVASMYRDDTSHRNGSGKSAGQRAVAPRSVAVERGVSPVRATVERVWSQRALVDYSMQRRATLTALFSGGALATDVCDADPYLLRAAKHHGEPAGRDCPVCRRGPLTELRYVYGDELGPYQGRIRSVGELEAMAREHGEFRVYVVEVCQGCSWNHLVSSFVLGDGVPRRPPRARRDH